MFNATLIYINNIPFQARVPLHISLILLFYYISNIIKFVFNNVITRENKLLIEQCAPIAENINARVILENSDRFCVIRAIVKHGRTTRPRRYYEVALVYYTTTEILHVFR